MNSSVINKIYVDGEVFYHPNISRLAVTEAQLTEDIETIDSLVLTAPYEHPYLSSIKPFSSMILVGITKYLFIS